MSSLKDRSFALCRLILKHLLLLALGAVIGLLALVAVFCLPIEPMQMHAWQSLPLLEQEVDVSEIHTGYPATLRGSFTDCLMLENAVYENAEHSLLEQVMYMYRGESGLGDGWAPGISLMDYLEGIAQPREESYARYWHGYLVVLKPLLLLTNFDTIRMIAAVVQLLLVGLVVMNCAKRGETALGMSYLFALPFLYFSVLYYSLSLSICFYLTSVLILVQLKWHEKMEQKGWYPVFFLLAGMSTSYFDFLTYPLITLGFPLCVCLYLGCNDWKKGMKKLIGYSAEWGIGYIGLWALKWVLTDWLVGGNIIADALNTILVRTGNAEGASKFMGYLSVLRENIGAYGNWAFVCLGIVIAVWMCIGLIQNKEALQDTARLAEAMVFVVIALFPFVWFFVTQNHSEQHWMFTCKILSVSVFAMTCGMAKWSRKEKKGKTA